MTHPTHGLDPDALEAATPDQRAMSRVIEEHLHLFPHMLKNAGIHALYRIVSTYLAALSQNPGTSEAEPVAWRFKADDPHYDDAYVYCATEEMALLRCPKNSKVEPLYAALDASDRARTIEECAKVISTMRSNYGDLVKRDEAAVAIRKLSEVSHE